MSLLLTLVLAFQSGSMPIVTIARTTMSHVSSSRQAIARTPSEWAALWKSHAGDAPLPQVDLQKSTVVAVFLGDRSTAGYSVEITGTRTDGAALVVVWNERKPAPDQMTAQIITSPAHLASIPAFAGEIRFEKAAK